MEGIYPTQGGVYGGPRYGAPHGAVPSAEQQPMYAGDAAVGPSPVQSSSGPGWTGAAGPVTSATSGSPLRGAAAAAVQNLSTHFGRSGRIGKGSISMITRVLLVATFLEDALRVLSDLGGQARFLRHFYGVPVWAGTLFLLGMVCLSVSASLAIIAAGRARTTGKAFQRDRALLSLQERASYVLIVHILVQQALYGRDAPATGGNVSFLVRNICLAGSFLMVAANARIKKGLSALPGGLLGGFSRPASSGTASGSALLSSQKVFEYMQLTARIMLVLLPIDFLSSLGFLGTLLAVPVMVAVLAGYRTRISGSILIAFYAAHNLLMSAFWKVNDRSPFGQYARDVKQYEFVQTISIMAGVLMLVFEGPGALSFDQQQREI
ncbi:similar to surfeit locus protein 4 [Cyanidioschyzon merolae strain 10D]|uniref:Similar to surfeit locus protein 4 n=1 Tax=Cyanidioschyzon merolae (strain NIES-3377 / 10D) TaxID=280699 RepID=M1V6V6_CYAM1|nr:similar to surfeit locus protein 4 [Cyanidioschyzon merolae strain 10D]BAM82545.1 similar to surfeit locus protein 4 [Cyanidioschyzon merolae strain 10D]|eukprot:XP_005538581.1 similar to surfeit locus protein 4 [Cyanidioschyzon merolae strain 10D]